MKQLRQQIGEMLAVHTHYAQVDALWTCLRVRMEEDIKARQDELHADWAKMDANREKKEGRHESL
jgi:hypothetical protein